MVNLLRRKIKCLTIW